jgi:hypothetical protein
MKQSIPIIALILLLSSCTKQIEFDGEETDPMPVMVSYVEADSAFSVKMSLSRFFLSGGDFKYVNDASLRAEVNGVASGMTFRRVGEGYYLSDGALHAGDTMTLHVSVPGHGDVTAGCRMPEVPVVTDIKATPKYSIDSEYWEEYDYRYPPYTYTDVDFSFVLHEPAGRDNYNMIRAFAVDSATGQRDKLVLQVDDDVIYDVEVSDDIIDLGSGVDYSSGWEVLFSDDRIGGQRHTIKGTVQSVALPATGTVVLQICSVSRDTYLYLSTLKAQQYSGGGITFIEEPVQIHTNVEGGIGILGAISPKYEELITLSVQPYEEYEK